MRIKKPKMICYKYEMPTSLAIAPRDCLNLPLACLFASSIDRVSAETVDAGPKKMGEAAPKENIAPSH